MGFPRRDAGAPTGYIGERVKRILIVLAVLVAIGAMLLAREKPSNHRDWAVDQAILPYAEIHGPLVTIHNIRNFRYTSTSQYTPAYYDKTFDVPFA